MVFICFVKKVLYDFFRKKNKKMSQNLSIEELNARLAEIYQMLSKIQDLGDIIMYNPDIDRNIKCVFLAWFQMKVNIFAEEIDQISAIVIGE